MLAVDSEGPTASLGSSSKRSAQEHRPWVNYRSTVTTVGLDLAKLVIFVHAIDDQGQVDLARKFVGVIFCRSSRCYQRAWSAYKPAARVIFGAANSW